MNSQWISVDDRLPGDELEHHLRGGGIKVLVTNGEHIYVAPIGIGGRKVSGNVKGHPVM